MNCKSIRKKLFFYIDKEISPKDESIIKEHLKTCKDCQKVYNNLSASLLVIEREKSVSVNPYLFTGILQKIKAADNQPVVIPSSGHTLRPVYITVFIAIAIFLGVALGNTIDLNTKSSGNNQQSTYSSVLSNDYNINNFDEN